MSMSDSQCQIFSKSLNYRVDECRGTSKSIEDSWHPRKCQLNERKNICLPMERRHVARLQHICCGPRGTRNLIGIDRESIYFCASKPPMIGAFPVLCGLQQKRRENLIYPISLIRVRQFSRETNTGLIASSLRLKYSIGGRNSEMYMIFKLLLLQTEKSEEGEGEKER